METQNIICKLKNCSSILILEHIEDSYKLKILSKKVLLSIDISITLFVFHSILCNMDKESSNGPKRLSAG